MALQIKAYVRPNGRDGYEVHWTVFSGEAMQAPPIHMATFEATKEGRREATMFKNGFEHGLRVAANVLEGMAAQ